MERMGSAGSETVAMSLKSLVLCADERIVRVLRRVLSELEIDMHHCAGAEFAIRKLTRSRFEAVIVDYADPEVGSQVLRSARSAPGNKHAVAIAILDPQQPVRAAFDQGAHFVLYKPISMERAKSSFRAARALMKRERRRNARVPVQIPVVITSERDHGPIHTNTIDLGEGGIAVKLNHRIGSVRGVKVAFTLPGTDYRVECAAEIAWESAMRQTGIRFNNLSPDASHQIKTWLARHTPELEPDDPPAKCRLTDLSIGGCYLELSAPFPVRTVVTLSMQAGSSDFRAQGVVRVMHPEIGMGIEFTRKTLQQREKVEAFIQELASDRGVLPDLCVEPEGLLYEEEKTTEVAADGEDLLLNLFRKLDLTTEEFRAELVKQRGSHESALPV